MMVARIAALVLLAFVLRAGQGDQTEEFRRFLTKIQTAMDLKPGSFVADIGSGDSTDLTAPIGKAIGPAGKLICEDVDGRALQRLAEKLKEDGLRNVDFVVGASDDPKLPAHTFDAIMISNAYHEFTEPRGMLKHVREALKRGGKLVVIEAISPEMRDKTRDEQVKAHELAPEILKREVEAAGFRQGEMIVLRETERITRYLVAAQPE